MDDETTRKSACAPNESSPGIFRSPALFPAELRAHRAPAAPVDRQRSKCVAPVSRYLREGDRRQPRPEYAAIRDAVQRCTNRRNRAWPRYGGRGIRVCDRWMGEGGFDRFFADMGPRPEGHSLDRIDNDGDYEPSNCRWASVKRQNRNMRSNRRVEIDGETMCLAGWAERYGVPRRRFVNRLESGWDPLTALTSPVRMRKRMAHEISGRGPTRVTPAGWGKSAYRGVSKSGRGWGAIVTVDGKQRWLGTFDTEAEAAEAYDVAALDAFGEAAGLNFPERVAS